MGLHAIIHTMIYLIQNLLSHVKVTVQLPHAIQLATRVSSCMYNTVCIRLCLMTEMQRIFVAGTIHAYGHLLP